MVAVAAAALLVTGWRPQLLYAAVATAGLAVLADGRSNNIGWFGVCLLAAWCVLTGSRRRGVAYWAATMILFAVEWRWVRPDPGWGAWLAGVTLTVAFSLLIKHDRDLLRRLRQAQAGLAEQAKTQERNRIARELHDVIGHTLTVSLLHVQSARLAVEHDPADAARALAEAERLGRECLTEVRSTVGLLRQDRPSGRDGRRPREYTRRCLAPTGCPRWWNSSGRRAPTSPSQSRAMPAACRLPPAWPCTASSRRP